MGEQAHAPGPWAATLRPSRLWHVRSVAGGDFGNRAVCYTPATYGPHGGVERSAANASLIAAAPDLLEACQALVEMATSAPPVELVRRLDRCVEMAAAAIAKATALSTLKAKGSEQ